MATDSTFDFIAVVVLYGDAPSSSRTLQTFPRCTSIHQCRLLVIVDHTPLNQSVDADAFARQVKLPVVYHHDPTNPPLGAAYNRAIRHHLNRHRYVLILDQDTSIPATYIDIAASVSAEGEPMLMAPTISAGARLVSPSSFFLGWGRFWKEPRCGSHPTRHCVIINSGAFIHRRVFVEMNLYYNEDLRLYGIDTEFFYRFSARVQSFSILPIILEHDLSFDSATISSKARKLRQMLEANDVVFRNNGLLYRLGVRAVGLLVRLVYALRHRSWEFVQ